MNHEIKLYGAIDGYWNSAEEIIGSIPDDATEITMRIHSPGGSVWEGVAIYNALRDHKAKVTTIVEGYAASIASVIMLAGDVRKIHKSSMVMIHNPWAMTGGNAEELRKVAENLDVCAEAIVGIYEDRTDMSAAEINDLMESESYFLGELATDRGFATEVMNDVEAENKIAAMLDMDKFVAQTKEKGVMGTQMTRKQIETAHAEDKAKLEAMGVEFSALKESGPIALDALKAEHVTAIEAKDVEITGAKAEVETAQAKIVEIETASVEAAEAHAAIVVEFDAAKVEIEAKDAELIKAKAALENPAVADAILAETTKLAQAQAEAIADDAERDAIAKAKAEAPKDIVEEYERMEQGADRQAFLAKNERAIYACYNTRETEGK